VTAAALLLLRGIDPSGEPFLSSPRVLVREVWQAVLNRAAEIERKANER
jgi:hypothetical protein